MTSNKNDRIDKSFSFSHVHYCIFRKPITHAMQMFHLLNKDESVVFNMFYILYNAHLQTSVYLPIFANLLLTAFF